MYLDHRERSNGRLKKLHNEELHNFYTSYYIIIVIKSVKMRWAGYVERMRTKNGCVQYIVGEN